MLAKLGCSYVVVGHSERREHHDESDATVNAKAKKAIAAGMTPIVCVGEGLEVRKEGRHVEHTLAQVDGSLAGLQRRAGRPAWSSPTSRCGRSAPARSATPDDAQEVCAAIRAPDRRGLAPRTPPPPSASSTAAR